MKRFFWLFRYRLPIVRLSPPDLSLILNYTLREVYSPAIVAGFFNQSPVFRRLQK